RRNSGVAVAYHAREHGLTDRPGFVLVQGRASFSTTPDRAWLESITPQWDRFLEPRLRRPFGRLLDVYYWQRVAIRIDVERVIAYPDDAAMQAPEVLGSARGLSPPAQAEPRGGVEPRTDAARVAAHEKTPSAHPVGLVRCGQSAGGRPGFGRGRRHGWPTP